MKSKVIVVAGPTASGKTDLAIKLAKEKNGELISADSRQIYKYMSIGTNVGEIKLKDAMLNDLPVHEIQDIPIYLVQFLEPDEYFNVSRYKILAESTIKNIISRNKTPILVGGTGLYIDAIINNYELPDQKDINWKFRAELQTLSVSELQNKLSQLNSSAFDNLNNSDRNNKRRLIRRIEIQMNPSAHNKATPNDWQFEIIVPAYNWPELKNRINNRVEQMFTDGLIAETKKILSRGFPETAVALQGIGYRQVLQYLNNQIDLDKCKELVKIAHRQYAKRQITWFKKYLYSTAALPYK